MRLSGKMNSVAPVHKAIDECDLDNAKTLFPSKN